MIDFQGLGHNDLWPWAAENDIAKIFNYDTQATRDILSWRQQEGTLKTPGEDWR
jgi:hypothetical protein